jgi:hypothetical protein
MGLLKRNNAPYDTFLFRSAARPTKAGRVKVADWLKYIENGAAKSGTADPMGTYDFTWMWEELGLSDLRR